MKKTIREQLKVIPNELLIHAIYNQPLMSKDSPYRKYTPQQLLYCFLMDDFEEWNQQRREEVVERFNEKEEELQNQVISGKITKEQGIKLWEKLTQDRNYELQLIDDFGTMRNRFLENCKNYTPEDVEAIINGYPYFTQIDGTPQEKSRSGFKECVFVKVGKVKVGVSYTNGHVVYDKSMKKEIDSLMDRPNTLEPASI